MQPTIVRPTFPSPGKRRAASRCLFSRPHGALSIVFGILVLIACCAPTSPSRADNVNNDWCYFPLLSPGTSCVVNNPVYLNVFLAPDQPTWDSFVAAQNPTMLQSRINSITQAILSSSYFGSMAAYQVNLPGWGGSVNCGVAPPTTDAATDDTQPYLTAIIQCINQSTLNYNIVNLFLPPQVSGSSLCTAQNGGHVTGNHVFARTLFGQAPVTIISADPSCNKSFGGLIQTLSHEMVEAASHPTVGAEGYQVRVTANANDAGGNSEAGDEIGDLCELNGPNSFIPGTPFYLQDGLLAQYWDNNANGAGNDGACTTGVNVKSIPSISAVSLAGKGQNMSMTLTGAFGSFPTEPASRVAGFTPAFYVRVVVSDSASNFKWAAGDPGNTLPGNPPNTVQLGSIAWQSGSITIAGFGDGFAATSGLAAGDNIAITVISPTSGQSSTFGCLPSSACLTPLTVPSARDLDFSRNQPGTVANNVISGVLKGVVLGSQRNGSLNAILAPMPNVPVALSGGWNNSNVTVTTGSDGSFSVPYTATPLTVAGKVTVTATATGTFGDTVSKSIPIWQLSPKIQNISVAQGGVNGGQQITVSGTGFDPGNIAGASFTVLGSAVDQTAPAVVDSIAANGTITLTMPRSPLPGDRTGSVGLAASVNGLFSNSLKYFYLISETPLLTEQKGDPCNTPYKPVEITLTAFKNDGSVDPVTIQLQWASQSPAWVQPVGGGKAPSFPARGQSVKSGQPSQIDFEGVAAFKAVNTTAGISADIEMWCSSQEAKIKQSVTNAKPQYVARQPPNPGTLGAAWLQFVTNPESGAFPPPYAGAVNYVVMTGGPTSELLKAYSVRMVSPAELSAGLKVNSRVVSAELQAVNAKFVGNAVELTQIDHARSMSATGDRASIGFGLPSLSGGKYQLVHFGPVQNGFAWSTVGQAAFVAARHQFSAPAAYGPGIYAVVATD